MLANVAPLQWRQWLGLLSQPVLQFRHADVHREGSLTKQALLLGAPLQHFARGYTAQHTDQHRVGGAVALHFDGGHLDQCHQRTVGVEPAVTADPVLQPVDLPQKGLITAVAQNGVSLFLHIDPVRLGVVVRRADGDGPLQPIGRAAGGIGNLANALFVHHHGEQSALVKALVLLGIPNVDVDVVPRAQQGLQLPAVVDHAAGAGQQPALLVPQRKGQRDIGADRGDFDGRQVHRFKPRIGTPAGGSGAIVVQG